MEFIKKKPIIYVLSGKAESGKSFVASLMKKYLEDNGKKTVCISYASYLKEYAKKITNWDGNEKTKPRELLQNLGVELIKNQINDHFLINRIIEDIKVYSYFFDVIIISDARFVEEIEVIKNNYLNVSVIHINGKNNSLTLEQKNHSTETGLNNYNNYDYEINNYGSKEELETKIIEILKEV